VGLSFGIVTSIGTCLLHQSMDEVARPPIGPAARGIRAAPFLF
jgi:hypothetical protein